MKKKCHGALVLLSCLLAESTQEGTALLFFCFCLFGNNIIWNISNGLLWRLFPPPKLFQQVFVLIISSFLFFLECWNESATQETGGFLVQPVCACVWKHLNGSVTLSLHTTCGRLMSQSVARPTLRVLLVNCRSYFASDIKPDGCSHCFHDFFCPQCIFHPISEDCYNRKLKCRYWTKGGKKAATFTSCLLCSDVLGRKKKVGDGTKELSYRTEQ